MTMTTTEKLKAVTDEYDLLQGFDSTYDSPCPRCASDHVPRNVLLAFGVPGKGRICGECLEAKSPDLHKIANWIAFADLVIQDCEDREFAIIFMSVLARNLADKILSLEGDSQEAKWLRGDVTFAPSKGAE